MSMFSIMAAHLLQKGYTKIFYSITNKPKSDVNATIFSDKVPCFLDGWVNHKNFESEGTPLTGAKSLRLRKLMLYYVC